MSIISCCSKVKNGLTVWHQRRQQTRNWRLPVKASVCVCVCVCVCVAVPPLLTSTFDDQSAIEGDVVSILCAASGLPDPTYVFRKVST